MNDIKLLFITRDFSKYTERNTYYLAQELAKMVDLDLWYQEGDIKDILSKIKFAPDFILLNDLKESRCPEITGFSSLEVPFGIIVHDLHYKIDKRRKFIETNNVKHIFSIYRDAFLKTFPEFTSQMMWLPHFVNTEIFKDYTLPKEIDWLMMGSIEWYYPLRRKIYETMKDLPGFVYHSHPGYRNIDEETEKEVFVGRRYAEEINRAKIFLTDNSTLNYPIIKYYEVLACNTLLLAPLNKELADLGFIPGMHYIPIDRKNFLQKAEYYLLHEEERINIARAGYELVHANHSVKNRAGQLVDMIRRIVGK